MWKLVCHDCESESLCDYEEAVRRLRLVGLLRRESEPDEVALGELLTSAAPRMACPVCKSAGLIASKGDDEDFAEDDWQTAVLCEICRQPVPPERLEVLPGVRRCVACQARDESGTLTDDEPEFCPKCGAIVELRVSRGAGITRYKRFCTGLPPCRL